MIKKKSTIKTPEALQALVNLLSQGFDQLGIFSAKEGSTMDMITVEGLGQHLKVLLGAVAQVIHPKISHQYPPIHDDPARAMRGAMFYTQLIHQHCLSDRQGGRVLLKPLVMLLAYQKAWSVVVVLPAEYHGKKKSVPLCLFFAPTRADDPHMMPEALQVFYQVLTRGVAQRIRMQGELKTVTIKPPFPGAHFYNGSAAFPSQIEDAAPWCFYAALMSVMTGRVPHVPKQHHATREAALHWQGLLAQTLKSGSRSKRSPSQPNLPHQTAQKPATDRVAQAQAAVIAQLHAYQRDKPNLAKLILKTMRRLVKYGLLKGYRARYPALSEQADSEMLAQYLAHDRRVKTAIYALGLTKVKVVVPYLHVSTLLRIGHFKAQPNKLYTHLKQQAHQQLQALQAWQAALQTRYQDQWRKMGCLTRARSRLRAFCQTSYESSYPGLGDMLLAGVGEPLKIVIPELCIKSARHVVEKVVSWSVFLVTASTRRSDQISQWVGGYMVRAHIPRGVRMVGAGLGFMYAYYTGLYASMRLFALGWMGRTVGQRLAQPLLHDLMATLIKPRAYVPGVAGVARLTSLALTAGESLYQGSYAPILCALGGITGSETVRHIGQSQLPRLQNNPNTVEAAQSRASLLFLLSLFGYEMGHRLMLTVYMTFETIMSKEAAQQYALAQLDALAKETGVLFLDMKHPSIRTTPSLWWNTENPIQVTSIDSELRLREMDCQIQPIQPFSLVCDQPIIAETPRLH